MNCTLEEYIADVKSQLTCNYTQPTLFITYNYTVKEIDDNINYFKYCLEECNLSAYKALLFFYDYLEGDFKIK